MKSKFKKSNTPKNETIKTFSLECLKPLKHYSLQYLLNKAFPKPDLFIRQIFTYDLFTNLIVDDNRVRYY